MSDTTMIRDLTQGRPMRQLISYSLPFMLSNFLQQVYMLADMVIVGQFIGSAGIAAASIGGEVIMLFFFTCLGFTSSGQIIVSQHIGSGSVDRISHTIGTLFSFTFILSIVLTFVQLFTCDMILALINTPPESMDMAHDYTVVCALGTIPVFGYNAVSAVLRGMGDSKHPTVFVAISSVLNIGLDLLFVGPLNMGCFGAALATIIAQTLSFIVSLCFVYSHRSQFGFDFKLRSFAVDKKELSTLVKLGIPIALQSMTVCISMYYVNSCINAHGVIVAAVTAVGNKITLVATICTGALNTAGSTLIAQCFAAGKFDRVGLNIRNMLIISFSFTAFLSLLVILFPEQIFGLFNDDPEVIAMSHEYVIIAVIALLGFATRSTTMAFINGIGFSSLSFAVSLLDGIVARIGLSVLFGFTLNMGVFGFWLGSALAGHVFSIVGVIYYTFGKWRARKLATQ